VKNPVNQAYQQLTAVGVEDELNQAKNRAMFEFFV
jgi:hypothetical protein